MNEKEKKEHIDKMIAFIIEEAKERAESIKQKAKEDSSVQRNTKVEEEQIKLNEEFERKHKQAQIDHKIYQSNIINSSRLQILKTKFECIQEILSEAHKRISDLTVSKQSYQQLLSDLILQGMLKIMEPKLFIQVRQCDYEIVQKSIPYATKKFKELTGFVCQAHLLNSDFLPPPPSENDSFCSGGVVLSSPNGKIVCSNTLDNRLLLAFEALLPEIRNLLFQN
ncbi:atpase h -transporting v1 subunit e1a-related [Anaeramoeba ignava]|uniref:Atpase h -transporting v1 subunit e1a-related n=1 Tax=Anaeramoeba ignava TaxID=1746090 RepID=A0A9Q0RHC6_ANAIG|nr:atpase h -transporting v1 subunit e1a-related [Anaeramoeba ignava]|eukprot:Anaeramoba_ignava/a354562_46.p1 GENE.a354562_46~~a354562_46.p1  ORF type:complete len:224 (-),score=86.94 a354562_46:108-779(-)